MVISFFNANGSRALIELHKKRLMCLGSVPGRQNNVRESSIAALEMALNITRDITCMDDILSISKMPLAAVFLLQKAGTVAAWLEKHFNHMTEVLQPVTESLERASKRWIIASQLDAFISRCLKTNSPRSDFKRAFRGRWNFHERLVAFEMPY